MLKPYEDWLSLSDDLSEAANLESQTAEVNIMASVMSAIEKIFEIHINVKRIWTLHEIAGNQIIFYKSNYRKRDDDPKKAAMPLTKGLIGVAIREDEEIKIFPNVEDEDAFESGWDDCKSELIKIIRDTQGKPIGVINIESDTENDFLSDTNNIKFKQHGFKDKDEFEKYIFSHKKII